MKQKESAWVRGGTRTQATGTEAASRQTTISKTNNTTNKVDRQTYIISPLLLCGVENAIPRRDLMALTWTL